MFENKIIEASATMSRDRFRSLMLHLRFDDSTSRDPSDRFSAVRELFTAVDEACRRHYTPGHTLTIDESMTGFRGGCLFRQYLPSKAKKYGLKFFLLVDPSTNYVWTATPYLGKNADLPPPLGTNVCFVIRNLINIVI